MDKRPVTDGKAGALQDQVTLKSARTTVILPATLDRNLELLALRSRRGKGELIREAVTEYVRKEGLTPERLPSLSISYGEVSDAS